MVRPSRPSTLLAAGVLLVATLVVYGNALRNDFVIDDHVIVLGDRRVQQMDVPAIFTGEYWPGATGNRLYRPLTLLSLAANWAASPEPWTFRLVNVLLHALAGMGVYLLLRDLVSPALSRGNTNRGAASPNGGDKWWPAQAAALGGGLLFVVHPIHTTPLNQIVDRADIAAAALTLLALWLCLRDARPAGEDDRIGEGDRTGPTFASPWAGWWRPVLAAVLVAAALLFKESAVAIVPMVAVLDLALVVPRGRLWRRVGRCYGPLLAVVLAYFAARTAVLGGLGRSPVEISALDNIIAHPEYALQPGDSRFLARWGTPVAVFGQAVRLLLWPWPLSWDYSYAAIDNVRRWSDPRLWGGVAALAACLGGMWWSWRRSRIAFVAIGLGLTAYSVVSNTFFLVGSTFAERYLYLPSAGFCMLAAWLLVSGAARGASANEGKVASVAPQRDRRVRGAATVRWGRTVAAGAPAGAVLIAGAVLLACAAATVARNREFRDNATLCAADVRTQPRSARLWLARATDAVRGQQYDAALEYVARAQAIFPSDPDAWLTAAYAHWGRRDAPAALACIQECGRAGGAAGERVALLASEVLRSIGEHGRAIAVLRRLVTQWPGNATATVYNNLAWCLLTAEPAELRDPAAALEYAGRAVALQPGAGDVVETYVTALVALGRRDEARRVLDEALGATEATEGPAQGPAGARIRREGPAGARIGPADPHRERLVRLRAGL